MYAASAESLGNMTVMSSNVLGAPDRFPIHGPPFSPHSVRSDGLAPNGNPGAVPKSIRLNPRSRAATAAESGSLDCLIRAITGCQLANPVPIIRPSNRENEIAQG